MNTNRTKLLFVLAAFIWAAGAHAQTFTTLKSFGFLTNKVGTLPRSSLVLGEDGALYGTTSVGGGIMRGGVFKINTDASGFVLLKQFTNLLDGAFPKSALFINGTTLYGTTSAGGAEDGGTIFKINADGAGFTVLKNLPAGSYNRNLPSIPSGGGSWYEANPPMGGVTLSDATLYGTTRSGGAVARGTVFKLQTDGGGYTVLKEFNGPDGAAPTGDLVVSGATLYGTTSYGGSANTGTVFKVNIDGSGFAVLKHFTGPNGAGPYAGLVISGETLFGVTVRGGAFTSQAGTVFKINTDGSGFAVLKSFNPGFPPEGVGPMGRLLLSDDVLYGTAATVLNKTPYVGAVFRLNTDGTDFGVIIAGTGSPGARPIFSQAGLVRSGNTLYGTMSGPTGSGGGSIHDLVFSVNIDGTERMTLKHFDNISGDDARAPGPLTLAGGTLYGSSNLGGASNAGTVFKLGTNGSGYAILKSFNRTTDGDTPTGSLAVSGETIYGTARSGGANNYGVLFKLNIDGGGFTIVKNFDGVVVGNPAGMTLVGDTIYGSAAGGSDDTYGGMYKINTNGSGFRVLKDFNGDPAYQPVAEPLLVGNTLYGIAAQALFKINTDGSGYSVLRTFFYGEPTGYFPINRPAISGNTLYGLAYGSTNAPAGVLYKINTDGTGFAVVKNLTDPRLGFYSLFDGGLLISGATIYGATRNAVFQINTDGSDFAVIKSFSAPEGEQLQGDLILDGTTLYGSTYGGGEVGEGTIFRLDLKPRLTIAHASGSLAISWPSFAKDYILEQNSDMSATSWNIVGSVPEDDGMHRLVTTSTSTNIVVFRLRR